MAPWNKKHGGEEKGTATSTNRLAGFEPHGDLAQQLLNSSTCFTSFLFPEDKKLHNAKMEYFDAVKAAQYRDSNTNIRKLRSAVKKIHLLVPDLHPITENYLSELDNLPNTRLNWRAWCFPRRRARRGSAPIGREA